MGQFFLEVSITIIQVKLSSDPLTFFEDLGVTDTKWGLCHSKLFLLIIFKCHIHQISDKSEDHYLSELKKFCLILDTLF